LSDQVLLPLGRDHFLLGHRHCIQEGLHRLGSQLSRLAARAPGCLPELGARQVRPYLAEFRSETFVKKNFCCEKFQPHLRSQTRPRLLCLSAIALLPSLARFCRWRGYDLGPIRLAEARLQATEHLGFEAAHMIRRLLSQPTMEFFGQPQTDHPMSRPSLRQGKPSDGRSKHQANDQSGNGGNGDGHGDTPPIIRPISAITILRPHPHGHRSSYDLGSVTDLIFTT
jgi:hypothetical protein